jgi:hypothetical protein
MDERTSGWCDYGRVDLRDFASIIAHFTEREIDEMQAAIDERRRLARDGERALEPAEQPDYSPPTTWKKNPRNSISSILHNVARMGGGEFPTPPSA